MYGSWTIMDVQPARPPQFFFLFLTKESAHLMRNEGKHLFVDLQALGHAQPGYRLLCVGNVQAVPHDPARFKPQPCYVEVGVHRLHHVHHEHQALACAVVRQAVEAEDVRVDVLHEDVRELRPVHLLRPVRDPLQFVQPPLVPRLAEKGHAHAQGDADLVPAEAAVVGPPPCKVRERDLGRQRVRVPQGILPDAGEHRRGGREVAPES
mmetsp:Transcript_111924/g.297504  ORF Transcript_111924/g.297504 Transcript_111924/m.297504 type:complete len:208 (+) Transcript_111924:64-687(+)